MMAHKLLARLSFVFLFFVAVRSLSPPSPTAPSPEPDRPTVYELLPQYGLPSGLLPDNVVNYTVADDGRFVVELARPCYVQFEYLVYYDKIITGRIGYGSITDLKGIQVKRFFFMWFDVDEIKVDLPPSDSIYFLVGFINKRLKIDQFKTVHSCRGDGVSGTSCGGGSWQRVLQFQLPDAVREVEMLLTE